MPANVEIKAHYDEERLNKSVDFLGAVVEEMNQTDTFFNSKNGRLKLREEISNGFIQNYLIGYHRTNATGPTRSDFTKTEIIEPEKLKEILGNTLGIRGVVKKTRKLYLVSGMEESDGAGLVSRVHIDTVEGLGLFLELEVLMQHEAQEVGASKFARYLMDKLRISDEDLVSEAYIDILFTQNES